MNEIGCYKDCTNCNANPKCCSYFDEINSPVLNKEELIKIKNFIGKDDFYEIIGDNLFKLKVENNKCIFYENDKCTIYNYRPVDCKLYPFDIINNNSKYYLILYLLDCFDQNKLIKENNGIDQLINYVVPWIVNFTDDRNYTKMKHLRYTTVKEIK